ncbi:MAG: hypothetical protein V4819_20685 [Verrucomicrobiota bacterium]
MKLQPEDPRLTNFVLGELGPEDAAAVERDAAENPALQAEIVEMRALQQFLTDRLALPADKLLPHQRENVRRSARDADHAGIPLSFAAFGNALKPWLIPAATAAVLALATLLFFRTPEGQPAPVAAQTPAPSVAAPILATPANNPPAAPVLSHPVPLGPVAAADFPTLELPILSGKASLEWISKAIRIDHQLPPASTVRLEEILNGFPLRLNGVTAIARGTANNWHPDIRDSGMSAHVATLSTEMIPCPWNPSATLLLVSLRGNPRDTCDVRISYQANPGNVTRYRLLGFNPVEGQATGKLPVKLVANSMTNLAIEIEPAKPGGDLGSLAWTTDEQAAPSISLVHKSDAEPSDDARFGALVCTYAQWLAGEQAGTIDADIVSALAREIASPILPADRADFLKLIDGSLHLQRQ